MSTNTNHQKYTSRRDLYNLICDVYDGGGDKTVDDLCDFVRSEDFLLMHDMYEQKMKSLQESDPLARTPDLREHLVLEKIGWHLARRHTAYETAEYVAHGLFIIDHIIDLPIWAMLTSHIQHALTYTFSSGVANVEEIIKAARGLGDARLATEKMINDLNAAEWARPKPFSRPIWRVAHGGKYGEWVSSSTAGRRVAWEQVGKKMRFRISTGTVNGESKFIFGGTAGSFNFWLLET